MRDALGARAGCVETLRILSETALEALPPAAIARLGMSAEQKNVLLRVELRDLDRTLTASEANQIRNDIYRALHRGKVSQWAK